MAFRKWWNRPVNRRTAIRGGIWLGLGLGFASSRVAGTEVTPDTSGETAGMAQSTMPSFVSVGNWNRFNAGAGAVTRSVSLPESFTDGDYLALIPYSRSDIEPTTADSYGRVLRANEIALDGKFAGIEEEGPEVYFGSMNGGELVSSIMFAVRAVDRDNPIEAVAADSSKEGTSVMPATIVTVTDNCLLFCIMAANDNPDITPELDGWTQVFNETSGTGSDGALCIFVKEAPKAASYSTPRVTTSDDVAWDRITGAFKPGTRAAQIPAISPNIHLEKWKLTLPVDSSNTLTGTAGAAEVWNLIGYEKEPYYDILPDGRLRFTAPVKGALTDSSHYPRCELRETNGVDNEYDWLMEDGGRLTATLSVDELAKRRDGAPGATVIGQIHGPEDEVCRLTYDNGIMYYINDKSGADQEEATYLLTNPSGKKTSIPLGASFSYAIVVASGALTVSVTYEGETYAASEQLDAFWAGKELYFKAGNYCQVGFIGGDARTQGAGQAVVTFSAISAPQHP